MMLKIKFNFRNKCPICNNGYLKKRKRKNYPFGKKSKPVITKYTKCSNCGIKKNIF